MARSAIVGIPRPRCLPLPLGMYTRRSGCGWYPRRRRAAKAADLASGVFQRTPSTPAVVAPELLTTRKMARARPPNECVSRWTRALTLFHLLSATAFTIRAWSRRTVRQAFFHSMECQSGARPGAAPAGIAAADISACLPWSVGRGSLVTEHPREVSPLSRRGDVVRGRTHPLSDPLRVGVRFLPCILKGGRRMSHSKGTRGGRPSSLGSSQAADELGSPPCPSRRPSARTVDRPKGPHSKEGRSRTSSPRTESRILTATSDRSQYV